MSWRIIYVTNANKLSLNLNSLQVIQEDEKYFVSLTEIAAIVIEDYTSIITTRLLIELANQGIAILILGMNKMPVGEFLPISDNVRTTKMIYQQCYWKIETKNKLWNEIIKAKITNQIITLKLLNRTTKLQMLIDNIDKIEDGDRTNMEGISARIYFKELFNNDFIRFDDNLENGCLNLCYHIVRTIISKEIISRGFNTTLGINHKSQYNTFNLSDDIIEVFRPIVDYYVFNLLSEEKYKGLEEINKDLKIHLLDVANYKVKFSGKIYSILNVIPYYVSTILRYMEKDGKSNFEYPILNFDNNDFI